MIPRDFAPGGQIPRDLASGGARLREGAKSLGHRYNDKINLTDHKKCSIFLFALHLPYPLCLLIVSLV